RIAEVFGVGDIPKEFHIPIPDDARRWAESATRSYPRPWLMVGPGARWMTKRWPPEHFAALARRAWDSFGGTVFFVGGAEETAAAMAVRRRLSGPSRDLTDKPRCRIWLRYWSAPMPCWPTIPARCTW